MVKLPIASSLDASELRKLSNLETLMVCPTAESLKAAIINTKKVDFFIFVLSINLGGVLKITANEQVLLQVWNSLNVRLEPQLIKDVKVQVNKQKPSDVCPQKKHNSDC